MIYLVTSDLGFASGVFSPSMGTLDEGHFKEELENGVKLRCVELGIEEEEPETLAVEAAVRVLLQGLGEDINREGIRKTPLRVAKALREGTRGTRVSVLFSEVYFCLYMNTYAFLAMENCLDRLW